MQRRTAVLLVVLVIVLVGLGVWIGTELMGSKSASSPSPYTAVYLASGDIYFGRLSMFPRPKLSDAWFLQRGVNQQNQPQLGLVPFKSAFWGPTGDIYLNPQQVLFWAPVAEGSQVAQSLENPQAYQQAEQQQLLQQQQQSQAPSAQGKAQTTPPAGK